MAGWLRRWGRGVVVAAALAAPLAPAATLLLAPLSAEARAGSGGYSRPSARTPSVAPPSSPRTPSVGGGYRRPGGTGGGYSGAPSSGDLGIAGRGSGEALQRYRSPQDREAPRVGGAWGDGRTPSAWGARPPAGWTPPPYALGGPSRFGALDALTLWLALDTLSRPGSLGFFRRHEDDPGYREWRAEADRRAASDPELKARLDDLDRRLAAPSRDSGRGFPWGTAIVLAVILAMLWKARAGLVPKRRMGAMKPGRMERGPLAGAAGMIKARLGGAESPASPFRVGMTLPVDPTPFVLAEGATKLHPPAPAGAAGLVSVAAVGVVSDGTTTWHRLYLPDGVSLFQLHLGGDGRADECRLFQRIDQVFPATPEDWAFWLDEREGLLGWPSFETKDGKTYDRAWLPGPTRVAPRDLAETVTDLSGSRAAREQAMLYGAATGAAAPAPATEYVLVAAVERDGQAWIEVRAGIDVNPAALSLP